MSSTSGAAITTQPQGRKKEIESFVRDLDPLTVQGWLRATVVFVGRSATTDRLQHATQPLG